jgi:hypothetical protein
LPVWKLAELQTPWRKALLFEVDTELQFERHWNRELERHGREVRTLVGDADGYLEAVAHLVAAQNLQDESCP